MNSHPGLSFLKEAAEFHSRYITTVSDFFIWKTYFLLSKQEKQLLRLVNMYKYLHLLRKGVCSVSLHFFVTRNLVKKDSIS